MQRRTARRWASFVFTLAVLVLLFSAYVALVYHGDVDQGADWVVNLDFGLWIGLLAGILAFLFVVLLILLLAPVRQDLAVSNSVDVTCGECGNAYAAPDTLERPLLSVCPHCGHANETILDEVPAEADLPEPAPTPVPPPPAPAAAAAATGPKMMVLRCSACQTNFETPVTDERPLVLSCANCGHRGILRASEAAPAGEA